MDLYFCSWSTKHLVLLQHSLAVFNTNGIKTLQHWRLRPTDDTAWAGALNDKHKLEEQLMEQLQWDSQTHGIEAVT